MHKTLDTLADTPKMHFTGITTTRADMPISHFAGHITTSAPLKVLPGRTARTRNNPRSCNHWSVPTRLPTERHARPSGVPRKHPRFTTSNLNAHTPSRTHWAPTRNNPRLCNKDRHARRVSPPQASHVHEFIGWAHARPKDPGPPMAPLPIRARLDRSAWLPAPTMVRYPPEHD